MENEKRFRVLEIDKYKAELSKEKRKIRVYTFKVGFFTLTSIGWAIISKEPQQVIVAVAALLNLGIDVVNIKALLESIARKTMLESKLIDGGIINQILEYMNESTISNDDEKKRL